MKRHYEQIDTTYKRIKIERIDLKRKSMFEDNNKINKKIKLDDNEIYIRWKRDIIMYS